MSRNNTKIHYKYLMSNEATETIVFIHGLGLDMTSWNLVIPLFQKNYNVIMYDIRGHGDSDEGEETISWDVLVEDLYVLCTKLGVKEFHFVGHGLGGNIALQYTYRKLPGVLTITLLSTPCYYPEEYVNKIIQYRRTLLDKSSIKALSDEMIYSICYPVNELKYELLYKCYSKVSVPIYFKSFSLFVSFLSLDELCTIKCPINILAGEVDPLYPPRVFGISMSYFEVSRFSIVPDSSNCVQLDQPEKFYSLVDKHISDSKFEKNLEYNRMAHGLIDQHELYNELLIKGYQKLANTNQIAVQLMGAFRVKVNGEEITEGWNQRNAKRLLAFLLFHPSSTREHLYDTLWSNTNLEKARNYLRVSLNHLKNLLDISCLKNGMKLLTVDREHIILQGQISCDLIDFIKEVRSADLDSNYITKLEKCKKILENISLPLLSGFYDDWILEIIEELESKLVKLCLWMSDFHQSLGEYSEGIKYLEISIKIQPTNESLYEHIVRVCTKAKREREAHLWRKKWEGIIEDS